MSKFVRFMLSVVIVVSLLSALNGQSTSKKATRKPMGTVTPTDMPRMRQITNAQRKAAAARAAQRRAQQKKSAPAAVRPNAQMGLKASPGATPNLRDRA